VDQNPTTFAVALKSACWNNPGENPSQDHESQQDQGGLGESFAADLGTGSVGHGFLLISVIREQDLHLILSHPKNIRRSVFPQNLEWTQPDRNFKVWKSKSDLSYRNTYYFLIWYAL
jgi:hypothetical protein